MTRPGARPIRGARDFLELRDVSDTTEDFVDAWAADKRPTDLIRDSLEIRSDYSFVEKIRATLAERIEGFGLVDPVANAFLPELLTTPSFSSARNDGDDVHVRQAVIFERLTEDDAELLVTVDVWIQKWRRSGERHPPCVVKHAVSCELFDMADETSLGRAAMRLVDMLRDFPETRQNPRNATFAVTVLGDLSALGAEGTPENWRSDIDLLAHAFDVKLTLRREPTFTGTVADSTKHVIRFEPFEGQDPLTYDGKEIAFTSIPARALPYDEIIQRVASTFADLEEDAEEDPFAQRALKPGERVYHRKVGGKSGNFDRFDKGSDSPCLHGRFIPWTNSPKALKGFHRRYSNFQDSWLRHCDQKMNCGMYAVFAPQNI